MGKCLHDLAALGVQARVSALPERAIDRECQQHRQMLEDSVADHDRLVARIDADMDVQAERHQPAGRFLEKLDQAMVSLIRGNVLILPGRERMGASPEQAKIVPARDLVDDHQLVSKVGLDLGNILANLGIKLDITLKQLGFDRVLECRRDLTQDLGAPLRKAMVWLSTRLSSISTPRVGRGLLTNL